MRAIDIRALKGDSLIKFLKYKIKTFENSEAYRNMQEGLAYYEGKHAIDRKKRLGKSDKGNMVELSGLPNTIAKDNQYAKLVDQKINYLLSQAPIASCQDNADYATALQDFIDNRFMRTLGKVSKDALNTGVGWLYLYTDGKELSYKKIDALDIIPIWTDKEHESLDAIIRKRIATEWDENKGEVVSNQYVEYYTDQGITVYQIKEDNWIAISTQAYMRTENGDMYNWGGKIPFVYWRYNSEEITLLSRVKTLQDLISLILSIFGDRMLEDNRNTVLVIRNYGGEDPGAIRYDINQTGIIQVEDDGGVDALNIEINASNFEVYLRILKEKLIENGRGLDAKSDKFGNNPNQINIKTAYSDIELDAGGMALEYQASFEFFQWFFKKIYNYPENLLATFEFKRNIMVNEESRVAMISQSGTLLSRKTLLEKHPFVDDVTEEERRLEESEALNSTSYAEAFPLGDDHDPENKQK